MAARAKGEGGRGDGFIAWATVKGIVGMLLEDTTGPRELIRYYDIYIIMRILTSIVTADSGFHKGLHPLSDDDMLIMTEIMRLVRVMNNTETVTTRVSIFVSYDLIADNVNITLDLRLLRILSNLESRWRIFILLTALSLLFKQ